MEPLGLLIAATALFGAQGAVVRAIRLPGAVRHLGASTLRPMGRCPAAGGGQCPHFATRRPAAPARVNTATMTLQAHPPGLAPEPPPRAAASKRKRQAGHLSPGPVALSWAAALTTLALQYHFTDGPQLSNDAEAFCHFVYTTFPQLLAGVDPGIALGPAALVTLYGSLWAFTLGFSAFVMPATFPPLRDENGDGAPMRVPHRSRGMVQHKLTHIDYSYMALNSLCMPGLAYHFICLIRGWGLDLTSPPLFGIYPPSAAELVTQTIPELAGSFALYFVLYEFIYYWWHRAMHEVPALYIWVHKHHHQQSYPDRAAIDTFNTGSVESQVGLYLQLAVMWACGEYLGVRSVPGAIWFFTTAGYLSVLEHDQYDRALPFGLWRADEHHMHHAFVRCNYCPYTTMWDSLFGTYKPFEVKRAAGCTDADAVAVDTSVERDQAAEPCTDR